MKLERFYPLDPYVLGDLNFLAIGKFFVVFFVRFNGRVISEHC